MKKKIPIILDTDIGTDIDDTWALAMMLRSPELDVKLITSAMGDTTYRAKVIARFLEIAGRTDIPIGIGLPSPKGHYYQTEWVAEYDLSHYSGRIYPNGVQAIVETIMNSSEPVTLVCICPTSNINAALMVEPRIVERARFVGMQGCFRRRHGGRPEVIAEFNVTEDIPACQSVFTAPWKKTITPLDTCAQVQLTGLKYQAIRTCNDPIVQAVIENYRIWCQESKGGWSFETESSTLYDTVAVYLAFSDEFLEMEKLGVRITPEGYTVIDPCAKVINCAMDWKNLPAFEDLLINRLTGK